MIEIIARRLVNSNRENLKREYPDCWRWIRLAARLSGKMTENEANLVFQLARSRTPAADPLIVELGAWQGKTALLLAAGVCDKTRPRVVSVRRTAPNSVAGSIPDSRAFQRMLQRLNLGRVVETMVDQSPGAFSNRKGCIDLLFINATENYDELHRDLAQWLPLVGLNGVVVLHGVSHLPAPRYGDWRQIDGLAWASVTANGSARPDSAMFQDYMRRAAKELAENRHAIQALRYSWSWRLTSPLRLGVETVHVIAGLLQSFVRGSPQSGIAGLRQWMLFRKQVRVSGLMDEPYYRANHLGVKWAQISPVLHFFVRGAKEGDKPNELFDIDYYLGRYPDVAGSNVNPLVHYLKNGAYEGRDPHPYFDSSFYLEQNPDVREGRYNPLGHYLAPGIAEGRDPNPWFNTSEYLERNPEVVDFALNPLAHQAWLNRR